MNKALQCTHQDRWLQAVHHADVLLWCCCTVVLLQGKYDYIMWLDADAAIVDQAYDVGPSSCACIIHVNVCIQYAACWNVSAVDSSVGLWFAAR